MGYLICILTLLFIVTLVELLRTKGQVKKARAVVDIVRDRLKVLDEKLAPAKGGKKGTEMRLVFGRQYLWHLLKWLGA